MTWLDRHRQSELLASQAEGSMRHGQEAEALALYKAAADAEADALKLVLPDRSRTLGITAVSAVALYFKARELHSAEELALTCLAQHTTPKFAKAELQGIVQTIWNDRTFRAAGVEFMRGELLVSVAGGLVAVGAAPLELVHRKIDEVKNLYFRAVEMLMELPLRRHGLPPQEIREQFRPWILQAPAGSYQFALRIEKPRQMELFPSSTPHIERVTDSLLRIVETASTGALDDFAAVISNEDYRECFMKQVRNLAPTGKTFERLTITSPSHADMGPVVFSPESRRALSDVLRAKFKITASQENFVEERVVGILRGVHLDKDWIEIAQATTGAAIRIFETGDVIDDLVGPMINHTVIADVRMHPDGRRIFRDIQSEE